MDDVAPRLKSAGDAPIASSRTAARAMSPRRNSPGPPPSVASAPAMAPAGGLRFRGKQWKRISETKDTDTLRYSAR